MSERPVLAPSLRELDEEIDRRGMPPGARARVAQRLQQEAQRREALSGFRFRWLPALTFVAGAALVLLVVALQLRPDTESPLATAPPSVLGGFTVHGEDCRHRQDAGDTVLQGPCRLVSAAMAVQTWGRTVMRNDDGVRMRDGTALFDVVPVASPHEPIRIHVSHGTIEVVGTRFTIEQGPSGGFVDLFEGRIRFVALDGVVTEISPGQRHSWGDAATVALAPPDEVAPSEGGETSEMVPGHGGPGEASEVSEVEATPSAEPEVQTDSAGAHGPSSAASRRSRRAPEAKGDPGKEASEHEADATAIIEAVERLQGEGRYAEAAEVLRRAETARRWDRRTAQVLSYELGRILERHLGDPQAACEHWTRHAQRFPEGRYARAVTEALVRLGCGETPAAGP